VLSPSDNLRLRPYIQDMPALLAMLLLAASVKNDGTPLRSGCAADEDVVATLPAGAPVTIRFALSGESVPCYKVSAESNGTKVDGYLAASAIDGLEEFAQTRRDARWLDGAQLMGAINTSTPLPKISGAPKGPAADAVHFIEISQPARALEILEAELRKKKDPSLLALAGIAAWRSDDSRRALEYWRGSLEIQPNPDLETLIRRVERETKGDQSTEKLVGMRVVLRYESTVPIETARQMLGVIDEEYSRIAAQLGCHPEERVTAIVQSRDAYRKTTDAAEWNGGQYDGRIRVPVAGGQGVDAALRRTLAHETTHACLSILGRWPAWLQEGLAQKLSGDTLAPAILDRIAIMAREKKLPRLENLGQDWSRLDTNHAVIAYALSLAAVELFFRDYQQYGLGNLIRNPEQLAQVTAELDKRLGL
jgi:hypothetical protein